MRPLTPSEADAFENSNPSWQKYVEQGFFWIWIIGNFVLFVLDDGSSAFLDGWRFFGYLIIFNLTVILLFIVYMELNSSRWRRNLKRIRHLEDLRLQEERRAEQLATKALIAREEKAAKKEKESKISAFERKNFQTGFNHPTNAQKEKAWKATGGKCSNYQCRREKGLSFWWVIHPDLEVKVYCDSCAKIEGLYQEIDEADSRSRSISEDTKNQVWNRDKGKCVQCGSNEKLEFDHIIPFSKGGANTKRNIQLLCEPCNRRKSDKIG